MLGIPVFSADAEAKIIMSSDIDTMETIRKIAGKDVYSAGNLNRSELAKLIFNDVSLLQQINKIVHPIVFEHFNLWTKTVSTDYMILEAAILFESCASGFVDKTVLVVAPVEERIDRVIRRNNLTREQVLERIKNQMTDEEKIKLSDYVINNSEHEMIIPPILKIHEEILKLIKSN